MSRHALHGMTTKLATYFTNRAWLREPELPGAQSSPPGRTERRKRVKGREEGTMMNARLSLFCRWLLILRTMNM